ncbi:hypothetical protein HWV62_39451 [Athelia sp. TMB]|nr:hypothetical protein HWV62_39451 [Athelia sp. TMB]
MILCRLGVNIDSHQVPYHHTFTFRRSSDALDYLVTQQRKRKQRVVDDDAEVETTPENSEEEEKIMPRVHATRARVAQVPEIPLPRTDRSSRARSGDAQKQKAKPAPPPKVPGKRLRPGAARDDAAVVEGSSTDQPSTTFSHLARRGVGPAGRASKILNRGPKVPTHAARGDSATDSVSGTSVPRKAPSVSGSAQSQLKDSTADPVASVQRSTPAPIAAKEPAISSHLAKLGRLPQPPASNLMKKRPENWQQRAANAKDVMQTISPFLASPRHQSLAGSASHTPSGRSPRPTSTPPNRSEGSANAKEVTPPFAPGELTQLLLQDTPSVEMNHGDTPTPPPYTKKLKDWVPPPLEDTMSSPVRSRATPPALPARSASPMQRASSLSPSSDDPEELEETERGAFTSPANRHELQSPFHGCSDGLDRFEDDGLDFPAPFEQDLTDDDGPARSKNGASDGEEDPYAGPEPEDEEDELISDGAAAHLEEEARDGHHLEDSALTDDVRDSRVDDAGGATAGPDVEVEDFADELNAMESDEDDDDDYGNTVQAERDQRRRRRAKEEARRAKAEELLAAKAKSSSSKVVAPAPPAAISNAAPSGPKTKPVPVLRVPVDDVTTGFDDLDSEYGSSVEEEEVIKKGKGRAVGRPSAAALARCNALGDSTREAATAIADEFGLQYQTVMYLAGLGSKANKPRNISNAVKKVFAHEYREEHGENAPDGAADAHYAQWKAEHGDDLKVVKAMFESAKAIDDNVALDGVTANQLRNQCLSISKQLTHLCKIYLNTQGFMILGSVIYLGDEFASSIFASDEDLLNKLLEAFGVAKDRRAFLHKVKVKLQNRQLEVAENPQAPVIPLLCDADFIKPDPNSKKGVRDWVMGLVSAWLRQEANEYYYCSRFVYVTWQSMAFKHNLVLVGTDKHMPFQPGAFWSTRENRKQGQSIMGQQHFMSLLKRIDSDFNRGEGRHYALEPGSLPLCILPLDDFLAQCPDVPRDPQPAVVSHEGEVLVYATPEHYRTDVARDACVEYDVIPFPPKPRAGKGKKKISSPPRRGVTKPPVRRGPPAQATSTRRSAEPAPSPPPAPASPIVQPAAHRRVIAPTSRRPSFDSQSDSPARSLHIPSPYVSAPYVAQAFSPLDAPEDLPMPTRKRRKMNHQDPPGDLLPVVGQKRKLDDIAAEDAEQAPRRPAVVGRGPPPVRAVAPATPRQRKRSRQPGEMLSPSARPSMREPSADFHGNSRALAPPARASSSRPQAVPPLRAESLRPQGPPHSRAASSHPHGPPSSLGQSSRPRAAMPSRGQSSHPAVPMPRASSSRPRDQPRAPGRPVATLHRQMPFIREASQSYERDGAYAPSDHSHPQRIPHSAQDRYTADVRYVDRDIPARMDYLQVPGHQYRDPVPGYRGNYYYDQHDYHDGYSPDAYGEQEAPEYSQDGYDGNEYTGGYEDGY